MNEVNSIIEIKNYLSSSFVGRDDVINGVMAGLISGEPTLLIGPPGTAKTSIIDTMSKLINAKYFYYLLTKFTEPEELLGPIDINALKNGEYKNITRGKLPDANIIFLDEIFKASSAIRNTLLDIMLNRRLPNGDKMLSLDILGIYSASNEISTDDEDRALYDRYPIKIFHRYIEKTLINDLLEHGIDLMDKNNVNKPLIGINEILYIQEEAVKRVKAMKNDNGIFERYIDALSQLEENNVLLSDRRKIKLLKIASAFSILMNSNKITGNDISMALRYSADYEEDLPKIEASIIDSKLENNAQMINDALTLIEETKSCIENTEDSINKNLPYNQVLDKLSLLQLYIKKLDKMKIDLSNDNNPYHKDIVSKLNYSLDYAGSKYEKLKAK